MTEQTISPGGKSRNKSRNKSKNKNKNRKLLFLFLLSAIITGSIIIPLEHAPTFTLCIFRNITGYPCPSCGMGRGFLMMGRLEIASAWGYNIMSPLVFPAVSILWLSSTADLLTNRDKTIEYFNKYKKIIVPVVVLIAALSWVNNLFINPHF